MELDRIAVPRPPALPSDEMAELRQAARGLEAALFRQLLEAMQKAQLEEGGFFGQQSTFAAHQTTFELFLADAMAENGPLGLADQIAEQLSRSRAGVVPAPEKGVQNHQESPGLVASPPHPSKLFKSEAQVNLWLSEKMAGKAQVPVGPTTGVPEAEP